MKTISICLLLLFVSPFNIFGKKITLTDALEKKMVLLSSKGEGGHSGKCLKLTIKNLHHKNLEIVIPAGLIFHSTDPSIQDLILLEEKILVIEKNKNRVAKLHTACIEAPKGSPILGSSFNIGALATGKLLETAQFIFKEKMHKDPSSQYAIWAVTDDKRVENIDHSQLANYTADLLGRPRPEYVVVQRATTLPGEPAYRESPSILKGRFEFTIEDQKTMTFGLYTKEGELMHAFFKNKRKIRGLHKFNFTFKVFNMPQGDYLLRLMDGEKVQEEMEVSF